MRKYEVVLIIRTMEEEALNEVIAKFENLIQKNEGTVDKIDRWGKKRLAYEIKDVGEGIYVLFHITAQPKTVAELDRVAKITDEILKHMIVKEDE